MMKKPEPKPTQEKRTMSRLFTANDEEEEEEEDSSFLKK